ncbi:MAG: tetraacyldisaccharide 4'-kinase [Candidatus Hydrogenedentes bacterium]|nr:tetraacyldisaccharide 4'-kinase [Candidatus Hydrogenedentota bacterium]
MTFLKSLPEKIRTGQPVPWYIDAALAAGSPVYRLGMFLRSLQKPVKVEARVISFGNLTAGGTGKTPAVIERAQQEIAAGNRVSVLTRGYGATNQIGDKVVFATANSESSNAATIGDEPALILRRVPEVVIAKGADRVAAARTAMEQHACNVLILDDGFQYLQLARDENVLVVDATNPFGNGHVLPRGILREPIDSASRATHILLTHCDRVTDAEVAALRERLQAICPNCPIRTTYHAPDALWNVRDGSPLKTVTLQGADVVAVCAIARPESFVATLESLGANVVERRYFPDHAQIPPDALRSSHMMVVTEKDAVRLGQVSEGVVALGIRLGDWPG